MHTDIIMMIVFLIDLTPRVREKYLLDDILSEIPTLHPSQLWTP